MTLAEFIKHEKEQLDKFQDRVLSDGIFDPDAEEDWNCIFLEMAE